MIKAIASDGAFTGEDQSDSAFSLTPSKLIRVPEDYPTIQAAIDAASSGSTIKVSSGTYFEHLIIGKPLKLMGEDKNTTVINGSGSGYCVHITADNIEISGFSIESGDNGIYVESSDNCIVDNNSISDNGVGIYLRDSNYNLITHNNFEDNSYQAYDNSGTNAWDKGASVGGNYWSNHTCTGNPSDGSQPYSIDSNSIDHYPFQRPGGWVKKDHPSCTEIYLIIDDPCCKEYAVYVDGVYQFTEGLNGTPDGYCAFYVSPGTHTIEIRKSNHSTAITNNFECGITYRWVSMPYCWCGG